MTRKTLLILAVPAVALAGAAIAQTAQVAPTVQTATPPASEAAPGQPVPVQFFGGREGRGDHGQRGGHGPRGMMGRGGPAGMMMQMFEEVDADGDGSVTQAEIDAYRAARVGAADTNGDGSLSLNEFQTLWAEQTRPRMVDAFQNLDDDGDGQITEAELDRRVDRMVARLDRDGDGALTPQDRGGRDRDR